MSEGYSVAILGATGLVGEALLTILEQREFPVRELFPLASERSAGRKVRFRDREYTVEDVAGFDFSRAQIGLFSAGASVSEIYAPKAGDAGCVVIDNTSRFRLEDDIPLVVPEVNPDAVGGFRSRNIIANPNCSTIQMVVALGPLHRAVGVERVNVA
ncbi:MAG: aspartate-semialdehyde dehydrogenase, partial [Chromatiales bacterium]|nr:aspartate-semialdehyde dehydrogenase [Chromatiales bacterium]